MKSQKLPSFSVDKSLNKDGIPKILITFPDGHEDNLILERYYPSKKSRTKEENHCNYFGHLEFDQEACVSVTGCYGKDNLEFTINSKHSGLNNMFIMTTNGNVESVESALNVIKINIFVRSTHFISKALQ